MHRSPVGHGSSALASVAALLLLMMSSGCGTNSGGSTSRSSDATPSDADAGGREPGETEASAGRGKVAGTAVGPEAAEADALLRKVAETYRKAQTYRDRAEIELSYTDGDERFRDRGSMAVAFARPNRIRVDAYQAVVVCDGKRLRALVRDPGTKNLDGQILDRPAPNPLGLGELLIDPLLVDQMTNAVLSSEAGRQPLQLDLLLAGDKLELAAGDAPRRLGPVAKVDGRSCQSVEVETPRGKFVFWIDRENHLVRKLEYPRGALIEPLAKNPALKDVKLTAEFLDAQIDSILGESTFAWRMPQSPKLVTNFVPPPQPLPSTLFGETAGEFSFHTPDGGRVAAADVEGKTVVLMWFTLNPVCHPAIRKLAEAVEKLKADANRSVYLVCTDPSQVSHEQIRDELKSLGVTLPWLRDLEAHGRSLFKIEETPTLVVLDGRRRVQIVEIGVNPQLDALLPEALARITRGDDLGAEVLAQHRKDDEAYRKRLKEVESKKEEPVE